MSASAAALAARANQSSSTLELGNTAKRDFLLDLERKYQAEWQQDRVFEVDAPSTNDPSLRSLSPEELRERHPVYFATYPYPYMNGSLHLGHGFTISKVEFASGFERMLGKRVLFPQGYHCTGMPIKASADKLVREMELFGEDFERFVEDDAADAPAPVPSQPSTGEDKGPATSSATKGNVDKSRKSKVAAKSTGLTYQFQIMESIGVPRAEIKRFADPQHWIQYFPPIARTDLNAFGARIDWRRSFVTTDLNPYYDAFVRWQTNRLHQLNYIRFGKRQTIFSPKDGQPCMDHDRQSGEGVGPQEYTGMKLEVAEWGAGAKDLGQKLGGKRVYMIAATLRPETMYGQTNCFIGPAIKYGLFAAKDGDVYLCTLRAARNMAYQSLLATEDTVEQLAEVLGKDLIGTKLRSEMALHSEFYLLPMDGVLANKGTGVVTSVPSDSPDDYATLMDLRKKAEFYGIDPAWAAPEPIAVLSTPTYGEMTAPALVKQLKIQSPKDVKQLAEAKEIAYREGFYNGTMLVGPYKGEAVETAKKKVQDDIVAAGWAFKYSEPEGMVMSRSADECVVALCDQWYMAYGEPTWRAKAEKLLASMNTYTSDTRNAFEGSLNWLREWACSRSYGLGSRMPWDKQFLVESLSDSTIYMAYYTIAHLLHSDIFGHETGSLGVTPDQMTDEIWDYVFCRTDAFPASAPLSQDKADTLRREFAYFYPMDMRTSGKDLIPNHLSFCIYVHAALFPERFWPRSMRANGHLLLNGKKMSKSTGNSLTLSDSIKKFGADASRIAIADAGDGIEDANFEEYAANATILRLKTLIDWCEEVMAERSTMRLGEATSFYDRVFETEMNLAIVKTKEAYVAAAYKTAVKHGFYELQLARDAYRDATAKEGGMNGDLLVRYIRTQALLLAPIAPHVCEHLWKAVLAESTSIQRALFPEPSAPVDDSIIDAAAYVRTTIKSIRDAEAMLSKRAAKGKAGSAAAPNGSSNGLKALRIFVARRFPEWQDAVVSDIKRAYDPSTKQIDMAKCRAYLAEQPALREDKKAMTRALAFVSAFGKKLGQHGADTVFNRTVAFDERTTLDAALPYMRRSLGVEDIDIAWAEDALASDEAKAEKPGWSPRQIEQAEPGRPSFEYYSS